MDIQVGDLVTYEFLDDNVFKILKMLVTEISDIEILKFNKCKILKIERPKYEVIEEKKELLTEEEKEFLKNYIKYYEIDKILFNVGYFNILDKVDHNIAGIDYPKNLEFNNIEKDGRCYTLKELGVINENY